MNGTVSTSQHKALPLFGGIEPGPVEFVVEGLILDKQLNSLFGDGGLGKSYLALHLAFCVATGRPFFGREVCQRSVLYIDVENLGHEETLRRAYQIARGYGLDSPQGDVYYYAPEKALGGSEVTNEVKAIIDEKGIGFIVLDSLTLGAVGTNASDQVEVVKLLKEIHGWGVPVLTLDHITKSARSDQSKAQAFGSVMKRNAARSMLKLYEKDGRLVLSHDKINCGPKSDPIFYNMDFSESTEGEVVVTFRLEEVLASQKGPFVFDAPVEDIKPPPPLDKDRVYYHVGVHFITTGEPVGAGTIADKTGILQASVSTHLSDLKKAGVIRRVSHGLYAPVESDLNQLSAVSHPYKEGRAG